MPPTEGSTGPVGRRVPHIIIKIVSDRLTPWGEPVLDDHTGYRDNVAVVNCEPFWKRLGMPLPRGWCRHVWMVKDWSGWGGVLFTWFLIVFGEAMLFAVVIAQFEYPVYGALNGVFSLLCGFLGSVAHVRATFSDPVSLHTNFYQSGQTEPSL